MPARMPTLTALFTFVLPFAGLFSLAACQGSPPLAARPLLSQAAQRPAPMPVSIQQSTSSLRFPTDWQGNWAGRCSNTGPAGKQTYAPVEMRLSIRPKTDSSSSWQWKIEYLGDQHQVRDYTLKPVDAAKGHWLIDEHNGILLDNFLVTGQLVLEQFSVGSSLIFGRHQLNDANNLKVELVSFSLQNPRNTGTQEFPVSSFKLLSVQDCPLKRKS